MFEINCPTCERVLNVKLEQCGKKYACPHCQSIERAPGFDSLKNQIRTKLPPVPGGATENVEENDTTNIDNNLPPVPAISNATKHKLPPVPNSQPVRAEKASPNLPQVPRRTTENIKISDNSNVKAILPPVPAKSNAIKDELPPAPNPSVKSTESTDPQGASKKSSSLPPVPSSSKQELPAVPSSQEKPVERTNSTPLHQELSKRILTSCFHCHAVYELDRELISKTVKCQKCRELFVVIEKRKTQESE